MRDREIQIAVRIGHETEEIGRVGLTRPDRQHLPAGHLGFVRPAPGPSGSGLSTVFAMSIGGAAFGMGGDGHRLL